MLFYATQSAVRAKKRRPFWTEKACVMRCAISSLPIRTRTSFARGGGAAGSRSSVFFNTSGLQYKALGLKEKLPAMSEEEQLSLLATDGC